MLNTIQSLRGLAALAVLAYHLSISFGEQRYFGVPILSWLTWKMNLGVDFFFVLSGFIIMKAHHQDLGRPERVSRFIERRVVRLYPIYWIYSGVFIGLVALGFGAAARNPETLLQWLTTVSLIRFTNMLLPISPAWTLIHEVAFYAFFALMILHKRAGIAAFAIWQVTSLVLLEYPGADDRTPFATYLAGYNLDFTVGLTAFYLSRFQHISASLATLAFGVLLIAATLTLEYVHPSPSLYPLPYAVAFGAIITSVAILENSGLPIHLGILPFIGNASYTIYLTHEAVMGVLLKLVKRATVAAFLELHIVYGLIFVATAFVGCLLYVVVERPVLKMTRSLIQGSLHRSRATPSLSPKSSF